VIWNKSDTTHPLSDKIASSREGKHQTVCNGLWKDALASNSGWYLNVGGTEFVMCNVIYLAPTVILGVGIGLLSPFQREGAQGGWDLNTEVLI